MGRDYTSTDMTHYYHPETSVVLEEGTAEEARHVMLNDAVGHLLNLAALLRHHAVGIPLGKDTALANADACDDYAREILPELFPEYNNRANWRNDLPEQYRRATVGG